MVDFWWEPYNDISTEVRANLFIEAQIQLPGNKMTTSFRSEGVDILQDAF